MRLQKFRYEWASSDVTIVVSRRPGGGFVEFDEVVEEYVNKPLRKENTTIGVVATNAELTTKSS